MINTNRLALVILLTIIETIFSAAGNFKGSFLGAIPINYSPASLECGCTGESDLYIVVTVSSYHCYKIYK